MFYIMPLQSQFAENQWPVASSSAPARAKIAKWCSSIILEKYMLDDISFVSISLTGQLYARD